MLKISRMNISISPELHRLIQEHAQRAGLSAPAYVREAVARAAGWDDAMARFEERIATLEAEIERLKQQRGKP